MSEPVRVATTIEAPAELVWDLVADVTRMGEWSPETRSCRWLGTATGPEVGARFTGRNTYRGRRWQTVCTIIAAERGRDFAFDVVGAGFDVATWRYEFRSVPGGCEVIETWVDRRNAVMRLGGVLTLGILDRADHNRRGMERTLAQLKAAAES